MSRNETTVLWLIKGLRAGGAERLLVEHAGVLSDDLRIVAAHLGAADDLIVDGLTQRGVSVVSFDNDSEYDLRWAGQLCRIVSEQRITVVHAHSPYPAAIARVVFAGRKWPQIVYTEHNLWSAYGSLTRRANAVTFPKNASAFAVSREVHNSMGRVARCRTRMLHHGIDLEVLQCDGRAPGSVRQELCLGPDTKLVCTVANYRRKKDYPTLLRAAKAVLSKWPDVVFICIGDGPEENRIKRLADDLSLGAGLRLLGFRGDARRFIAAADLFLLASAEEGLPVTIMEAMGLGVPVIATQAGGVPELVEHGITGVLVPVGDFNGLARAVLGLLLDPARRRTMSHAARQASTAFEIRRAAQVIEATYRELTGGSSPGATSIQGPDVVTARSSLVKCFPAPAERMLRLGRDPTRALERHRIIRRLTADPTTLPTRADRSRLKDAWGGGGVADVDYLDEVCNRAAKATEPILESGSGLTTLLMGIYARVPVWALEEADRWAKRMRAAMRWYRAGRHLPIRRGEAIRALQHGRLRWPLKSGDPQKSWRQRIANWQTCSASATQKLLRKLATPGRRVGHRAGSLRNQETAVIPPSAGMRGAQR